MSPIATQPAPSPSPSASPPSSPLAQVAHLSIPAASILARFQVEFTAIVKETDPNDPKLRPWFEQYAMLQQAALCERLYNLFEENFNCGGEEVRFIKLLLQALTIQEKTAARRDRAQRDASKQAREEARKAKDQQRLQNAQQTIEKAKETLDRLNNLNHASATSGTIEAPAPASGPGPKDARVPAENENLESSNSAASSSSSALSTQNSALSPQDATAPAQKQNPAPVAIAAS